MLAVTIAVIVVVVVALDMQSFAARRGGEAIGDRQVVCLISYGS